MSSLTIRQRLLAMAGAALLIILLTSAYGIHSVSEVKGNVDEMANNWLPSVDNAHKVLEGFNMIRRVEVRYLVEPKVSHEDTIKLMATTTEYLHNAMAAYEKNISSDEERQIFEDAKIGIADYIKGTNLIFSLVDSENFDDARNIFLVTAYKKFGHVEGDLKKIVELNQEGAAHAYQAAVSTYRMTWVL